MKPAELLRFMKCISWTLSSVFSVIALIVLVVGLLGASSAVQEASVGVIACAVAIIPYTIARAVQELIADFLSKKVE